MVVVNWRGVVASPGLSPGQLRALRDTLGTLLASPRWHQALTRNGSEDAYLPGDEFAEFLHEQATRVGDLLWELGLDPG